MKIKLGNTVHVNDLSPEKEPYVIKTPLDGMCLIKRPKYPDTRGSFQELYRIPDINSVLSGIKTKVLQAQISVSKDKVLRGIHVEPRDKIITPIVGRMAAVIVDLRPRSATFKKWVRFDFDNTKIDNSYCSLFVPQGCGNSLCVYTEKNDTVKELIYHYTYSSVYDPKWGGMGIRYDDQELNINWPVKAPIISDRDRALPSMKEFLKLYK